MGAPRSKPHRPCLEIGCPNYAVPGQSRCIVHRRERARKRWDEGLTGKRGSRPGWRALRQRVWLEQARRCAHCNSQTESFDLHHKNGDATDDRRENLVALCDECHGILHALGA